MMTMFGDASDTFQLASQRQSRTAHPLHSWPPDQHVLGTKQGLEHIARIASFALFADGTLILKVCLLGYCDA